MLYRTIIIRLLMLGLLSVTPVSAIAHDDSWNGGFVLGAALTGGGDTVGEVEVVRFYNNVDKEKLKGGGTVYLYGGFVWPLTQGEGVHASVQVTLGYHFDAIVASSNSVDFERFPIDLMLYQYSGPWRFGLGVTRHLSPTLDLTEAGAREFDFDNATGAMIEFGRQLGVSNQYLSLRYTGIEYTIDNSDFDGSNIGINYNFNF